MWQHLIVPHTYMYNKQPRARSSHYKLPQHGWNKQNVNQGNHRDYHIHILHRSFISVVGCNWYIMIFLFHLTHTVSLLEGLGARSGYLGHGWIARSNSIDRAVVTKPCSWHSMPHSCVGNRSMRIQYYLGNHQYIYPLTSIQNLHMFSLFWMLQYCMMYCFVTIIPSLSNM